MNGTEKLGLMVLGSLAVLWAIAWVIVEITDILIKDENEKYQ